MSVPNQNYILIYLFNLLSMDELQWHLFWFRITLFNGGHNIPHPYDITLNGKYLYVSDDTMQAVLKINVLDPRNDLVMLNQTANSRLNLYQIDFASVERQPQCEYWIQKDCNFK